MPLSKKTQTRSQSYIYGIHPISSAMRHNPWRIKLLFIEQEKVTKEGAIKKLLDLAIQHQINYCLVNSSFFKKNYAAHTHQGVVAEVSPLKLKDKNDLIAAIRQKKKCLFVVITSMQDAHNLGAIIRTSLALGVDGLIINQNRTPALNHTTSKVSSGAVEQINIYALNHLSQFMDELKKEGLWFYGLDMKGIDIETFCKEKQGAEKKALVVGEEGKGMSDLMKKKCDQILRIKMNEGVNSLNVSVSFAIAAYRLLHN